MNTQTFPLAALVAALCAGVFTTGSAARAPRPPSPAESRLALARLPLRFEPNRGQAAPEVRFVSRGPGYQLLLQDDAALLRVERRTPAPRSAEVRLALIGGNRPALRPEAPLPGRTSYFRGRHRARWLSGVPGFAKVRSPGVYPGVDLVYYGRGDQLEYSFIVAPRSDPRAIRLSLSGADRVEVDRAGDLLIHTQAGVLRQHRPVAYQERRGRRTEVAAAYTLRVPAGGPAEISFTLGAYDPSRPLVIDPVLSYSTYLGGGTERFWGPDDGAAAVAVDAEGCVYVAGYTASADFPTTAGAFDRTGPAGDQYFDVFVTKLDPTGTRMVYTTFIGGEADDHARAIAVDADGNAHIAGTTGRNLGSGGYPVTAGAFQPMQRGGASTAFVTKLNAAGSALLYSTYLGGETADFGEGLALGPDGCAYVTGATYSSMFPIAGGFQPFIRGSADAFVAKLNAPGTALLYSTFLGGTDFDGGRGIAVDGTGCICVTGSTGSPDFPTLHPLQPRPGGLTDAFVARVDPSTGVLTYASYLGGRDIDVAGGIALDAGGSAWLTGWTLSPDFPTLGALQPAIAGAPDPRTGKHPADAFLTRVDPSGLLQSSTYLGGRRDDLAGGVAVDGEGNPVVVGATNSHDFPTLRPVQRTYGGGASSAFVTKVAADGAALRYSTFLGGSPAVLARFRGLNSVYPVQGGEDAAAAVAIDAEGHAYVAGATTSRDFPTANPVQPVHAGGFSRDRGSAMPRELFAARDAFVTRIEEAKGAAGRLSLSRRALNFGAAPPGGARRLTVVLRNRGKDPLRVTVGAAVSPFRVAAGGGSFTLAPKRTRRVVLAYTPREHRRAVGGLTITSSDPDNAVAPLRLTGAGMIDLPFR